MRHNSNKMRQLAMRPMTNRTKLKSLSRLEQICSSLQKEGYVIVGKMESVRCLRHTANGNRITVLATNDYVAMMKNGRVVKREKIST